MNVFFFSQTQSEIDQLFVGLRLRWPDLRPLHFHLGKQGLDALQIEEPDLIMLCNSMFDMDVWQVVKEIRSLSNVPVVVAVEGSDDLDVVKSIETGADGHIQLPCSPMVVMARVLALMRRCGRVGPNGSESPMRIGDLLISTLTYDAYIGERPLGLTGTEFKLLYLLARHTKMTLSHTFLQNKVWGDENTAGEVLKKYIQRLRTKLGDDAKSPTRIKTVHGYGYRLVTPDSNSDIFTQEPNYFPDRVTKNSQRSHLEVT